MSFAFSRSYSSSHRGSYSSYDAGELAGSKAVEKRADLWKAIGMCADDGHLVPSFVPTLWRVLLDSQM